MTVRLLALAATCLLAGCGLPEPADHSVVRADPAIAGRYAVMSVTDVVQEFPGAKPFSSTTASYGFAAVAFVGDQPTLQETFCHIDTQGGPIHVIVPDAVTRSLDAPVLPLAVSLADGVLTYTRRAHAMPTGVHLSDPEQDPLPTEANDPRVYDQDGDGKPGITALIQASKTEEIYMVRRERIELRLRAGSADELRGPLIDTSEQVVIGASDPILAANPKLTPVDDPARSYEVLRRIDDDAIDCDKLVKDLDAHFPDAPRAPPASP